MSTMSPVKPMAEPKITFGLLPEPEGRLNSFFTSTMVNGAILALVLLLGMVTKHQIVQRHMDQMVLILPTEAPPLPKIKLPPPPKIEVPQPEIVKLDAPKIVLPHAEPKPEPKPIQIEAKLPAPIAKEAKPNIILAPQPKAALAMAAAPATEPQAKPSTAAVHFGDLHGVAPNPNATRPANVAAIGNPYGGMTGAATAPHGVVGSTGLGNGTQKGASAGIPGKVASAGIPGATAAGPTTQGQVASANIPKAVAPAALPQPAAPPAGTALEVLFKPPVQYTPEARQLKVQGEVVLRVTFTASGQVIVQSVLRGLGHGLDEEARREAQQIRFRPATANGRPVDTTTNIVISFQLT